MILVLIAYAQMAIIIARAGASNKVTGLRLGLSLHQYLYFVYASGEGSGESVHMHRLA